LALANDLVQKGWKIAVVDMNATQGEAVVAKFNKRDAIFIKADVSKWEDNVKVFETTKKQFGRIDFGNSCHGCRLMVQWPQMRGLTIPRIFTLPWR
jgi:NAD(P)-dependent dehydrogenase (short-subunit alcohol dehydrogenase family)